MEKIRFAQLSFWFGHAQGICAAAKRHPQVDLSCIWDDDSERGKAAAEKFDVPFIEDLDEVLANEGIDAVGICSPTQQHAEHAIAAIEHGKHCLVEKPFTRTIAQADEVIRAAETKKVQVMPVYNLRFTPANIKMKEMVDSGILGPIYQVRRRHGHREYEKNNYNAHDIMTDPAWPWFDADAEGRRSLFHAGSHAMLWLAWTFGMPECVVSLGSTRVPGLPVEDNNACVFRYESGLLATLHTSETETAAPLATEIYGFAGALVQMRGDGPSTCAELGAPGALMHYSETTKKWQPVEGISPQFQPQGYNPNDRFFDALLQGQEMPVTMYDGRRSVQLLAAAELADREQRMVEIAEITSC